MENDIFSHSPFFLSPILLMMNAFQQSILNSTTDFVSRVERGGLNYLASGPGRTQDSFNNPDVNFLFQKTNTSYSGTDCTVIITYNTEMLILGNLQTFSYSIYREKTQVRTLGYIYPKGVTAGSRTIAGSMIFTVFDKHPLFDLFKFFNKKQQSNIHRFSSPMADEIPPFDMMLVFNNEYGSNSVLRLYGVEITQEGGVFSINDIYSENTMQYIAKDMDPMIDGNEEGSWKTLLYEKMTQGKVIDSLYASLLDYKSKLENQKHSLEIQIKNLSKQYPPVQSFLSNVFNLGEARNNTRKREALEKTLIGVEKEIKEIDAKIKKYESTKMSWDMNDNVGRTSNTSGV